MIEETQPEVNLDVILEVETKEELPIQTPEVTPTEENKPQHTASRIIYPHGRFSSINSGGIKRITRNVNNS